MAEDKKPTKKETAEAEPAVKRKDNGIIDEEV